MLHCYVGENVLHFLCLFSVAGALRHPTTVDTGLAHGLAPTAHVSVKTNAYNRKLA